MYWSKQVFLLRTGFYIVLCAHLGNCSTLPKCCLESDHVLKGGKCVQINSTKSKLYTTLFNQFEFTEKKPNCTKQLISVESTFVNADAAKDKFTRNGYFSHNHVYYPSDDYCINSFKVNNSEVSVSVLICEPKCSESRPCFAKCCAPDEVLEFRVDNLTYCTDSGNNFWTPVVYEDDDSRKSPRFIVTKNIMLSKRKFSVYPNRNISNFKKMQTRILKNGEVQLLQAGRNWIKLGNEFCMDGSFSSASGELNSSFREFTSKEDDSVILQQFPNLDAATAKERTVQNIYKTAFFVSSIFLLVNITVYTCLWDTRKSVYWLTQLSYFVSLFFMNIFLATAYIRSVAEQQTITKDVMSLTCLAIGILAHFFFLSSFCWMTMINVDLWCRLGHHDNMFAASSRTKPKKFKKYIWYAAFGIGVPLTIVGGAVIVDNLPCAREANIITADYGRERCYVKRDAIFPYQYGPIGILLTVNLIVYVATVISVLTFKNMDAHVSITSKRSTKVIINQDSENHQSLRLFTKLFLIMGIPWILEVVGWAYGTRIWIWHIIDVINILQSVLIFFIFVCKRDIIRELRKKYPCIHKVLRVLHIQFGEPSVTYTYTRGTRPKTVLANKPRSSSASSQVSSGSDFSSASTKSFALSDITEGTPEFETSTSDSTQL